MPRRLLFGLMLLACRGVPIPASGTTDTVDHDKAIPGRCMRNGERFDRWRQSATTQSSTLNKKPEDSDLVLGVCLS